MGKRVLLAIDLLHDFMASEGALYCGDAAREIIPVVGARIKEFAAVGEPVIFVKDAHAPEDLEFERFPAHCVRGTPGAELIAEIADAAEMAPRVIHLEKTRYSAFYGTDLDQILKSLEVDEVHVVGVCTNICVLYTVEELCNRDLRTVVYRNAVASFDLRAHEWALHQMESVLGAKIR